MCRYYFYFFFQAEDGIRDSSVTGVQTCALPILVLHGRVQHLLDDGAQAVNLIDEQDRKSVVQGKSVDLGGRRIIKKKKKRKNNKNTHQRLRQKIILYTLNSRQSM